MTSQDWTRLGQGILARLGGRCEGEREVPGQVDTVGVVVDCWLMMAI